MTGSINEVTILGNLGADPEVRTTQSGVKVVSLRIATSDKWTDRETGESKERTEWHSVVIWGAKDKDGIAGVAEKYLKKGSKCLIEGRLQTRKWQHSDGTDRYSTEVVVQPFDGKLVLLGDASHTTTAPATGGGMDDSEIPFSSEWR